MSLADDLDLLLQNQIMHQDDLWPIDFSGLGLVPAESSEESSGVSPKDSHDYSDKRLSPVERKAKRRVQVAVSARRHRVRKKVSALQLPAEDLGGRTDRQPLLWLLE